jgi:hypothetical protein
MYPSWMRAVIPDGFNISWSNNYFIFYNNIYKIIGGIKCTRY